MNEYEVTLGNSCKLKTLPEERTERMKGGSPRIAINKVLKKWKMSIKKGGYFVIEVARVK